MKKKFKFKYLGGGLYQSFMTMTLAPLFILGILIILIGRLTYLNGLHKEVRNDLKDIGENVLFLYDNLYEGDYNLLVDEKNHTSILRKGTQELSGDTGLLESIKEKTGSDITLFFYDTRMVSTLQEVGGDAVIGTTAHAKVVKEVLEKKQDCFFNDVQIVGKHYFVEYIPFFGEDGTCTGMIGVTKSSKEVTATLNKALQRNMMMIVLIVLVVALFITNFTTRIVIVMKKMMRFLGEVAEGKLDTKLDPLVLSRRDEIGEMGRSAVKMQTALRKLVERDELTGLYNRRSGHNKLILFSENAQKYAQDFSIAIGDIDFFKKVNDTYGHEAGDLVLKEVARILNNHISGKGAAIRWGGEEFLLVFDGINQDAAIQILREILDEIRENRINYGEVQIGITMTFGITEGKEDLELKEQIKAADANLYFGKEHGRNRIISDGEAIETYEEELH